MHFLIIELWVCGGPSSVTWAWHSLYQEYGEGNAGSLVEAGRAHVLWSFDVAFCRIRVMASGSTVYCIIYIYIYEYMYVYIYIYHIILYRIGGWLFCETNLMAAETFMSTSDLSPESLNPESLGAVPQIRRAFFGPPYMMLASG